MKIGMISTHLTAVLASSVAFCTALEAATITNGSFEDVGGMSGSGSFFNGVPVGWTFTGTSLQALSYATFGPAGGDGQRYIESLESGDLGTLYQSVTGLSVGQQYSVNFFWGNRLGEFDMTVEMGGATFNQAGNGVVDMQAASLSFIAADTDVTLNLTWNNPTESSGALDAFSIEETAPVPIPASLALLFSALGGLGFMARRKRKAA